MDTTIRFISAFGLVLLGLLIIWFVYLMLRRSRWWRCQKCHRCQDELGNYGWPGPDDMVCGDNICSRCQLEERGHDGFRRDVSDAELERRISGPHA